MNTTNTTVTPSTSATSATPTKTRKPRKVAKQVPATKKLTGILRKSKMAGPVSKVHEFLDTHPKLKRSEAISALVKRGVAFYTARTQYQVWFSDRKAAAKARKPKGAKKVAKVAPIAATGS